MMLKTPGLTPYQRKLFRLLYRPDGALKFWWSESSGYHYKIVYSEDGQEVMRTVEDFTFSALEEYCEMVRRRDGSRESGYAWGYKSIPRDLVTDEDRAWMADYYRQMEDERD